MDANVTHIINDFLTTLKGKARIWFDMNVPEAERTTLGHWNAIRDKFKAYFHPLGSTKEQRIRAWKDMKWDPIKEAIDILSIGIKNLDFLWDYNKTVYLIISKLVFQDSTLFLCTMLMIWLKL